MAVATYALHMLYHILLIDWQLIYKLIHPRFDPGTLVNINTTNLPVGFIEGLWLTLDVIVASFELFRLFLTV